MNILLVSIVAAVLKLSIVACSSSSNSRSIFSSSSTKSNIIADISIIKRIKQNRRYFDNHKIKLWTMFRGGSSNESDADDNIHKNNIEIYGTVVEDPRDVHRCDNDNSSSPSLDMNDDSLFENELVKEVDVAPAVVESSSSTLSSSSLTIDNSKDKSKGIFMVSKSAIERTGGAITLIIAFSTILNIFGSKGIVGLCILSQAAMFQEVSTVLEAQYISSSDDSNSHKHSHKLYFKNKKWLCFATVQCFTTLRALSTSNDSLFKCMFHLDTNTIQWVGYALSIFTLISSILSMEYNNNTTTTTTTSDTFKTYLEQLVTTVSTLLFLLGQSTFWIYTLQLPSHGLQYIIYSSILVIINDTMAYICGKSFGKTPLLPNLSPNKTYEGFIGAAFLTIFSSTKLWNILIISKTASKTTFNTTAIVLACFASFIAPFGGFLASAVKRALHVKDFGSLIPGHGGVMDRLDCHLIMAPFCYMFLKKRQGL